MAAGRRAGAGSTCRRLSPSVWLLPELFWMSKGSSLGSESCSAAWSGSASAAPAVAERKPRERAAVLRFPAADGQGTAGKPKYMMERDQPAVRGGCSCGETFNEGERRESWSLLCYVLLCTLQRRTSQVMPPVCIITCHSDHTCRSSHALCLWRASLNWGIALFPHQPLMTLCLSAAEERPTASCAAIRSANQRRLEELWQWKHAVGACSGPPLWLPAAGVFAAQLTLRTGPLTASSLF